LIYLFHVIKGTPFTEMAKFLFGGDPRRLSEAKTLFINYAYSTFYNKIYIAMVFFPVKTQYCHDMSTL
jgi:hypothetical protein